MITTKRKRQWGTEKSTIPLSILHEVPSLRKIALSKLAIVLTVILWFFYILSVIVRQLMDGPQNYSFAMEAIGYSFVVSMLIFSSLMYLVARYGALKRFSAHKRVSRLTLDKYFSKYKPSITVLVPSYNEEYSVIRKTLISAFLQEYPNLRVVLLLDDKPNPTSQEEIERLNRARNIKNDIRDLFSAPFKKMRKSKSEFLKSYKESKTANFSELNKLSNCYLWAASWLKNFAKREVIEDHVDDFFVNQVILELAKDFLEVKKALDNAISEKSKIDKRIVLSLYNRLVWTFKSEIDVFERKKYASLSHEPNKAMNLNSYIGLMGKAYKEVVTDRGLELIPTKNVGKSTIVIPDSDFILSLDADSILLREYCLRLVYYMQQPENQRVAVAQTPYSSFRGAYTRIEYLAGATTDIQHILHQGKSYYNATFWVGANAIIRKKAIEDIVEIENINGVEVKRYIQDRTVIEDTESSIDLGMHGWTLMNYPERLSYSATPPDFGSLIVQRRRWANGGLIILAKLLKQMRIRKIKNDPITWTEFLLRVNYMASIAWATFGLMFLLVYPYDGRLLSPLVLLAAMPYFISMASDLKYCGYRYSDIFRIYGFNLIMLPVNLAGVLKSIEQAITGKKIPFARTPKVKNRTRAGIIYLVVPILIVAFSIFTAWRNILLENWGNAIFATFNAFTASWAIVSYIGIRNLVSDIWFGIMDWLYIDVVDKKAKAQELSISNNMIEKDWRKILFHGTPI
ncbi:MAG: glycosyltransferase [Patescibacteria group bacterium]|nr:glycosyltransferase [Patescibacteria group bacterium]